MTKTDQTYRIKQKGTILAITDWNEEKKIKKKKKKQTNRQKGINIDWNLHKREKRIKTEKKQRVVKPTKQLNWIET